MDKKGDNCVPANGLWINIFPFKLAALKKLAHRTSTALC